MDDYPEYELEQSRQSPMDRIEQVSDSILQTLGFVLMPWKLVSRGNPDGSFYQGERLSLIRRLKELWVIGFDYVAANFGRCLDWLEYGPRAIYERMTSPKQRR